MKKKGLRDGVDQLQTLIAFAKNTTDMGDGYSVGLLNGMILAEALLLDKEPNYERVQCGTSLHGSSSSSA
jgi:hypothetical protein